MKYAEIIQSALCRVNLPGISRPKPSLFFYPGLHSKPLHLYSNLSESAALEPVPLPYDSVNDSHNYNQKCLSSSSSSSTFSPYDSSLSNIAKTLKQNYDIILNEYKELRKVQSSDYKLLTDEHKLHQGGSWEWNSYILKGKRQSQFATICPQTVNILESFQSPTLMTNVPFSYAFFSTLGKNTNIASHYGPCNLRLRCHFPLVVPTSFTSSSSSSSSSLLSTTHSQEDSIKKNNNIISQKDNIDHSGIINPDSSSITTTTDTRRMNDLEMKNGCGMQLAGNSIQWLQGEAIFFDDTYEHSVWNNTDEDRVVLLFDIWHPELTVAEIEAISDMFRYAQDKGWLNA